MNDIQREDIRDIVVNIRALKAQKEAIEATIKTERTDLQDLLEEAGENWKDGDGYARIAKAGQRVTWDVDKLEELGPLVPAIRAARSVSVSYDKKKLAKLRLEHPRIDMARIVKEKPEQLQVQ